MRPKCGEMAAEALTSSFSRMRGRLSASALLSYGNSTKSVLVAARSQAWVSGRWLAARIPWMSVVNDVCVVRDVCKWSSTRPEDPTKCGVSECDLKLQRLTDLDPRGLLAHKKNTCNKRKA
jgi:hypothetical protein